MSVNNLWIQGIGFVGTLLFFVSFQFKDNRTLFRVQFLSYLFYTVHLLLLGAITGALFGDFGIFKVAHDIFAFAAVSFYFCLSYGNKI